MEEHRSVRLSLELLQDGGGETRVDRDVPVVPSRVEAAIDRRRVGELPEVVLDEPQHRIRHDVVEPVVGLGVVCDEAEPER